MRPFQQREGRMYFRLFVGVAMASGLLGLFGGQAAETSKAGAPKPPAIQMEAPADPYEAERVGQLNSMIGDLRSGRIGQDEFSRLSDAWHRKWYPELEGKR